MTPVLPPTLPAVWTLRTGLPTAPIASARYNSGITTPSNMSGALPNITASIASHSTLAANMALSIASRTNPPMDTSLLLASYLVCPTPITPA